MNLSSSTPPPKRSYRMAARADAKAATGERLLSAAWRHFATRPYEQVRLREIASEAEVTAQTLHLRFGSKDELFTAAFLSWAQAHVLKRDAAPVGEVREAVEVLFDHYEVDGTAVLRLLSQEERIPAVREMTGAGRVYHRQWVARTFAPLLHGLPRAARARRLTAMVVASDLLVWKLLRQDMHLDRAAAERVVVEMLERA